MPDQLAEGSEILIPKVPFRPSYLSPGGRPKMVGNPVVVAAGSRYAHH